MKRLLKIFIVFLYLLQISQVFAEESKMYINYNNREYIFDDPWLDSYSSTVLKGEHKIYSGVILLEATFISYSADENSGSVLMKSGSLSIKDAKERIECYNGLEVSLDGNSCILADTNIKINKINEELEKAIEEEEIKANNDILAVTGIVQSQKEGAYNTFYESTYTGSCELQAKYIIINSGSAYVDGNSISSNGGSTCEDADLSNVGLYEEREYLKSKGYTENGVTDDYYYGTVLLDGSGTYYEKVIYRDAARKIYEDKTETQQENLNKALSDAREYEFQEINMINIQKSNRIAELRETARKEIARLSSTGLSSSNNNGNTGELIDYNNMVNYNDVTALSTVGISFNPFLWLLGGNGDINVSGGSSGIVDLLVLIAYDFKIVMYIVAGVYFLILVLKLLFASNTDEEVKHFKNGIIWISLGIIVMQIAYFYVDLLYGNANIDGRLADNVVEFIIEPFIRVIETAASFFFVFIMIFAFYRTVTANGSEEAVKNGRMTILYALIGFIVVKLAGKIVSTVYGKINCKDNDFYYVYDVCELEGEIDGFARMIVMVVKWMNSFVGILTILVIIYVGAQLLFSNGDTEKLKKAKMSILYVAIGIAVLVLNYLILTFIIGKVN